MHIDFSAHNKFDECPAAWYELYIHQRRKRWPKAQRDDALALGSLVHAGLQVWQERHVVEVPQEVIDTQTPSMECLALAQELIVGYTRAYPEELWPLVRCEEPVVMPLLEARKFRRCRACGYKTYDPQDKYICCQYWLPKEPWQEEQPALALLAKIDHYFYVPEPTMVPVGVGEMQMLLPAGWWVNEYKTKSPYDPIGLYMQQWEVGLQASYQTLALEYTLAHNELEVYRHLQMANVIPADYIPEVQGILVNVLEKPRRHIPQRTCKACRERYEFATWIPTGRGSYNCPVCGNEQVLPPLKEAPVQIPPAYYRFPVLRSQEQLARDKEIITTVGQRMIAMEQGGLHSEPWRKGNCVQMRYKRACDYFQVHASGLDTREDDYNFQPVEDYRGLQLVQIEEAK